MIVGLVGFIGSGKGTVADIMTTEHGFSKESFAGGVKDAASVIFGWDRKLLEGDTEESRAWRETPDEYWSEKLGYSRHLGMLCNLWAPKLVEMYSTKACGCITWKDGVTLNGIM